jgi:hypothetical protein
MSLEGPSFTITFNDDGNVIFTNEIPNIPVIIIPMPKTKADNQIIDWVVNVIGCNGCRLGYGFYDSYVMTRGPVILPSHLFEDKRIVITRYPHREQDVTIVDR